MGNTPSTEANRKSLSSRLPLEPHASIPSHLNPNKLSKPRTRRRSTNGRLRDPEDLPNNITSQHTRYPPPGCGLVSSFSSPKILVSSPLDESRPLPLSLSPASSPIISSSVFTLEETVASVSGQRGSGYWQPMSSAFSTPDLDLDIEAFQEHQSHQQDFQQRQQNRERPWIPLQRGRRQCPDDEDQISKTEETQKPRKRSSLFRSRSSRRPAEPHDELCFRRRNSIGPENPSTGDWHHTWDGRPLTYDQALSQYYGGPIPNNWPLPAHQQASSWNYDLSSYAAKRLLHIVDDDLPLDYRLEQASVASESREPPVVSEVTWKSSHPVQHGERGLSRVNSDLSMYAPVRRRSMIQVPGVATRRNSISGVVPGGAALTQKTYRHSVPVTPGVSRQASFESTSSRVMSMPPVPSVPTLPSLLRPYGMKEDNEPVPRVSTPCDRDYQAIGAFKLGSLRITNGTISPMSSPERVKTREVDATNDEQCSHNLEFDFAARTQTLAGTSSISRDRRGQGSVGNEAFADQVRPGNKADNTDTDLQPFPSYVEQPLSTCAETHFGQPGNSEIYSSDTLGFKLPQITLSDDVFAGFEFSLFSLGDMPSAQPTPGAFSPMELQTTSKNTAIEDDLFEDERSALEYVTDEVLDVRLDTNAKSSNRSSAAATLASRQSAQNAHSVSQSDYGLALSSALEASGQSLSKADSGYSSNVSLRSLRQAASKPMSHVAVKEASMQIAEQRSPAATPTSRNSSFHFVDPHLSHPGIEIETACYAPPPLRPLAVFPYPPADSYSPSGCQIALALSHYEVPLSPSTELPLEITNYTPLASPASTADSRSPRSRVSPALPAFSSAKTSSPRAGSTAFYSDGDDGARNNNMRRRYTTPVSRECLPHLARADGLNPGIIPAPDTPGSTGSGGSVSTQSIGSASQKPTKLRRLFYLRAPPRDRGQSTGYPVCAEDKADVPSDPQKTQASSLATRRLALKTQVSKDTLKTIFSVGSLEAYSTFESQANGAMGSLPSTTEELLGIPVKQPSSRRHTLQRVPTSLAHVAAAVMPSRKAARRKSRLGQTMLQPTGDGEGADSKQKTKLAETETRDSQKRAAEKAGDKKAEGSRHGKTREAGAALGDACTSNSRKTGGIGAVFVAMGEKEEQPQPLPSASSRIMSRTMSLTAQLERSLNMRLSFSRFSRPTTADAIEPETSGDTPAVSSIAAALLAEPSLLASPVRTSADLTQVEHDDSLSSAHRHGPLDEHGYSDLPDCNRGRSKSVFSLQNNPNLSYRASPESLHGAVAYPSPSSSLDATASSTARPGTKHADSGNGRSNRARSKSGSSSSSESVGFHQQQQRKAWDYYYQQQANQSRGHMPRGYHDRSLSMGSHSGFEPPYRILHSYNSPAYRGAPIWG